MSMLRNESHMNSPNYIQFQKIREKKKKGDEYAKK